MAMPLAVGAKYTTREELRKASQAVSKAPDFRFSQMYARRRGYVHLRKCKYSEISVVHRCVQLIPSHTGTFIRCTHLCTSDTWTLEPRVQLRLSLNYINSTKAKIKILLRPKVAQPGCGTFGRSRMLIFALGDLI